MAEFKQDMPPPGGYEPIIYARIPLKPGWNNGIRLGLLFGISSAGYFLYKQTTDKINIEKIEMRCSRLAMQPLLRAERDRMILKQLKKNRDDEEKLMKDVPGWEVGKWNHSPVFLSLSPDDYIRPSSAEYFAHSDPKITAKYHNIHFQL